MLASSYLVYIKIALDPCTDQIESALVLFVISLLHRRDDWAPILIEIGRFLPQCLLSSGVAFLVEILKHLTMLGQYLCLHYKSESLQVRNS